jgi:two-component system, OmpR family, sensor histidine kinase ChvG
MSLRLRLLLLGLATLVLPWAGCQYVREMESVLREGERESLQAVATTIASSLRGRDDLLFRDPSHAALGEGPAADDLRAWPLDVEPLLDGLGDEWPAGIPPVEVAGTGTDRLAIRAGVRERMLFVLADVHDDRLVYDTPPGGGLDPADFGDRVWLGFDDPDGAERQVFVAAESAGTVRARRVETRDLGREVAVEEPRITGAWRATRAGYRVELRVPLSMLGSRFGVLVDDRDTRGAEAASFGTLRAADLATLGRLIAPAPGLRAHLEQFVQPGVTLAVTSRSGALLARTTSAALPLDYGADRGLLAQVYRRVLDPAGERRVVEARAPIAGGTEPMATLDATQSAQRWLFLRDRALTRLINLTLIVSAFAVLAIAVFAARLAWRIARLRQASETALTRERLETRFPEVGARDELGDLARSFSELLGRLDGYTSYLRTLAGKLAHEIRTPLTIVRSSLDNLESETLSPSGRSYAARAREGSERLNAILVAMGAATRVEEAIGGADRTRFDLVAVTRGAVDAYRTAFPTRQFAFDAPAEPLVIEGAPELILQLLDKLIDNAVDFSAPASTITVRVAPDADHASLAVENLGPPLPPGAENRIFESLWQSRTGSDSRPHFGLGLYVVRLITEFHHGDARAMNLPEGDGVRFVIRLPIA